MDQFPDPCTLDAQPELSQPGHGEANAPLELSVSSARAQRYERWLRSRETRNPAGHAPAEAAAINATAHRSEPTSVPGEWFLCKSPLLLLIIIAVCATLASADAITAPEHPRSLPAHTLRTSILMIS